MTEGERYVNFSRSSMHHCLDWFFGLPRESAALHHATVENLFLN